MGCKHSRSINGPHDYQDAPNGWETCRNPGCGDRRRKANPKPRNVVEIKGGKWFGRGDRKGPKPPKKGK